MPTSTRCTYTEGRRRCPYQGEGEPRLCRPHRLSLAEAAKPRSPVQVLGDALNSFLAGKPINVDATIGAAGEVWESLGRGGMGHAYHPNIGGDVTEDQAHRRAQAGTERPPEWWEARGSRAAPPPPHVDPEALARLQARKVLGFLPREKLTEAKIREAKQRLARKFHPDRPGGSTAKMAAVNNAADVLIAAL